MKGLQERIASLPDDTALRVLDTITQAQLRRGDYEKVLSTELRDVLRVSFDLGQVATSIGEGEVARQALLVLAAEAENHEPLTALISAPPVQRFAVVETVALVAAVLVVLQTHVRFERDKDGRVALKIEKKPTSTELLKPLVAKLLALAGRG